MPWLCAAALVTVLRCLATADAGWDLTTQIQAVQHLLAGKGLSYYWPVSPELAEPAQLFTLTSFPCGYSVFAAVLIALGANVVMVVKVLRTTGTLLGWWEWGKLASPFFRDGLHDTPVWQGAGLAIAMVTPLLWTPPWGGTDLLLWAAVLWVCGVPCAPQTVRCKTALVCQLACDCWQATPSQSGKYILTPDGG